MVSVSIPWRTGVNMREFAYYGVSGIPNFFASAALQRLQLEALRALGVKLVRFYASQRSQSTEFTAARVKAACDVLAQFGMQAIICLDDAHAVAGWCVPGYDELHSEVNSHYNKRFFTQELYRSSYIPHIRAIAQAVKDNPGALMFELGNEYAIHPRNPEPSRADAQAFLTFARVASETLKAAAPNKLVSTGLVNTRHIANLIDQNPPIDISRQLHSMPSIDAVSLHYYFHDGEKTYIGNDLQIARSLNKPFYIGEFGAEFGKTDRAAYFRAELNEWRTAGALTAMPWAFDTSPQDAGISDIYSFAQIKGDFAQLKDAIRAFSADVQPFLGESVGVGTGASGTGTGSIPVVTKPPETVNPGGTGASGTGTGAAFSTTKPPFLLLNPMTFPSVTRAKFDDPANYRNVQVPRREGMLFAPQSATGALIIRAAQRGVVSKIADFPPGYGRYVCIEHTWYGDTYVTWYGHLERIDVQLGAFVNAGQPIGKMGRSGSATEISLFLTVQNLGKGRKGYVVDDVIDPAPLLVETLPPRDEAQFDADITTPDGTVLRAGEAFKKTWRVRNTGNTDWANYTMAFFSGNPMSAPDEVPVPLTRPGETQQISVNMIAPATPGAIKSTWMLQNAANQFFLQEQYVLVNVQSAAAVAPVGRSLARFVSDVTIPDGFRVRPGEKFVKTWRMKNDGETTWGAGFTLSFARDLQMGAVNSVPLPNIRPGEQGNVSVELTAPANAGRYRSTWQPQAPNGVPFDFEMYAEIVVDPNLGKPTPVNTSLKYATPVRGSYRVGLRFGDPVFYLDGKHKGVDFLGPIGLQLLAGGDGVVYQSDRCSLCLPDRPSWIQNGITIDIANRQNLFSTVTPWNYGFGNLVVIRHEFNALPKNARDWMSANGYNGWFAYVFYGHMSEIFVNLNAVVSAGTVVGTLGNSGNSTGPHVHVEVRLGQTNRGYPRTAPRNQFHLMDPLVLFNP
jgi:murein DD-endopeptidase MepM/ murein hydrolase activator NlpD